MSLSGIKKSFSFLFLLSLEKKKRFSSGLSLLKMEYMKLLLKRVQNLDIGLNMEYNGTNCHLLFFFIMLFFLQFLFLFLLPLLLLLFLFFLPTAKQELVNDYSIVRGGERGEGMMIKFKISHKEAR